LFRKEQKSSDKFTKFENSRKIFMTDLFKKFLEVFKALGQQRVDYVLI